MKKILFIFVLAATVSGAEISEVKRLLNTGEYGKVIANI